jgi:hypothetical protein
LTFKSIVTILEEADASGVLKRFEPPFDGDECEKRRLLISKELQNDLYSGPAHLSDYRAKVRAQLKTYVVGDYIQDDDVDFFRRLDPEGNRNHYDLWEIKVPIAPAMRIFGAFVEFDCFAAFTSRPRKGCRYGEAMRKADSEWNKIFPGYSRHNGWPLDQCISNCGARI